MTVNLCRIIVALTFIFSGFVKAIDPIGLQYKLQDYLGAIGIPGFLPDWMLLIMAVLLAAVEFCMGIFLLFAIQRRLISKLIVVFMSIMTLITVWLVVANPVKDCGCFGDALHLTNTETLVKNIILLGCSIVIMQRPLAMFRFISESNQWIVINYTIVFIFVSSGLSLYYLPLFDFRPYRIGTNIPRGMEIPKDAEQPLFETTFIMEKGGQRKEFTLNDYPDSTWKFIDSKTVQVKEGYIPPIHDFSIADRKTGKDLTDSVLRHKGYTFLLIAPYLERADDSNFGDIDQLYEYAQTYNIPFYCLTASTAKAIQRWKDITGAEYPFCITDETTLKTIVRSNPGLLLLKDGTIINKWSHNQLPNGAKLSLPITQSALGKMPQDSVPGKILEIILWFILPLTLLTLADRLWAWSKWVRLKEKKDKQRLYQLFNKKKSKMRKKIVAGNWKMNLNLQEGIALAKEINEAMTAEKPNCDVVICTPFIHLASVAQVLNADLVGLGAENCADKEKGAFTGEVSAEMVKSTGAQYVILGHSERRQYYGETAEILKEKVQLALKHGLKVIFCCGETLEERESDRQNAVVKAELDGSVFNLTAEEWKNIVLAYEPIWAIGTGKTATSDQAEEMLCYIRSIVAEKYGKEVAEETSILYGGSCKASNAPELFSKPNIDGGLIGGASLKAADFKGIIDAWKK
ncbi:triose-phosphate isomerase [Segatella oris F0302]|uniref:Triosephosphate isomerase n=1 Tax=Segatella oris F0302 TaxID=649760 RepID=D1QNM4_9BACT|nr:BT_3928 family protein [Segatella oris]EFB33083.1 triose-phosphate isomerase [Segatella oris F0302]